MKRRVLVTGANSGIGLATVLEVARLGFEAIGSSRSAEGAATLRRAAKEEGVEVETAVFDLSEAGSYTSLVEGMDLWAVVNNAGATNAGAFEDVPLDDARLQLEAMVVAPASLALAALPAMRRRGAGRVVNVLSISVGSGVPLLGWYQTCKHALAAITEVMRNELASSGVDVIAIDPGMVDTPIWGKAHEELETRYRGSWLRPSYERAMHLIANLHPITPPQAVAHTVGRALLDGKPSTTYPVGPDAYAYYAVLRYLPRRAADLVARKVLRT